MKSNADLAVDDATAVIIAEVYKCYRIDPWQPGLVTNN